MTVADLKSYLLRLASWETRQALLGKLEKDVKVSERVPVERWFLNAMTLYRRECREFVRYVVGREVGSRENEYVWLLAEAVCIVRETAWLEERFILEGEDSYLTLDRGEVLALVWLRRRMQRLESWCWENLSRCFE